ncbi:hypothetical protein RFI_38873 [Reticulomyxa filosa]|uniref:Uncharacterized protein n=1 Tax=Reticulomyxa filosa TaxID=46433 RepID=X6LCY1_RETFI|nr:hypothetical protein RFI_38873 [Reticulomyxa filosa]|eukprot:ETN98619.1 hypothetical protein RFI_38873 [Reticulomyxa filosa]
MKNYSKDHVNLIIDLKKEMENFIKCGAIDPKRKANSINVINEASEQQKQKEVSTHGASEKQPEQMNLINAICKASEQKENSINSTQETSEQKEHLSDVTNGNCIGNTSNTQNLDQWYISNIDNCNIIKKLEEENDILRKLTTGILSKISKLTTISKIDNICKKRCRETPNILDMVPLKKRRIQIIYTKHKILLKLKVL